MAYQTSAFDTWDLEDPTKRVITQPEEFERLMNFLETRRCLVFDYETNGLEWYQGKWAVGIAFGAWDDQDRFWAAYVPFRHRTGEHQLGIERIGPAIGSLLANPNTLKICHNIKFEDHFSRREGWTLAGPRYCTMVAAKTFDENRLVRLEYRAATDLGLGEAAYEGKRILDACIDQLRKQNKVGKLKYLAKHGYEEVPIRQCGYYAGFDVSHTGGLYRHYEGWGLSSHYSGIWSTEMDLTEVLCDTEQAGLPLDIPYLNRLQAEMGGEMDRVQSEFDTMLGGDTFELGSDDKLRRFMLERMGLTWEKTTKSGALSVDAEVLSGFSSQYQIIQKVLDWREFEKIESTYTHSLVKRCDANGFLHGDLKQAGTVTGRLSCKAPNYHNMPNGPRVRQAFLVRKFGWVRLFLDYSQVELRVLAWYSRDPIMVDVYLNNGDIHERTRLEVESALGVPVKRRLAKIVNFGLCVCEGQRVLTLQNGLVPIEAVESWHLVWDGVEWVNHDGLACRGEQEVITYDGITATPCHEVYLEDGTTARLGDLESGKRKGRIAVGARGETPVGYRGVDRLPWEKSKAYGSGLSVRDYLSSVSHTSVPDCRAFSEIQGSMRVSEGEVRRSPRQNIGPEVRLDGAALSPGYPCSVSQLQGEGNQGPLQVEGALHPVGVEEVAGFGFQGDGSRPQEQRRPLFDPQSASGNSLREPKEQASPEEVSLPSGPQAVGEESLRAPVNGNSRLPDVPKGSDGEVLRQKAKVYDLLNAGPRHRFTVEGKIVSNSYGLTSKGLASQSGMSQPASEEFLSKFFERYTGINAFRAELCALARRSECQWSNIWGRTRRVPDLMAFEGWKRRSAERRLVGAGIQGTAAQFTKISMVRISKWLKANSIPALITNTVHDEIQLDMPQEYLSQVMQGATALMEDYPEFAPIPIIADAQVTDTHWAAKVDAPEFFAARPEIYNSMTQGVAHGHV